MDAFDQDQILKLYRDCMLIVKKYDELAQELRL